MFRYDYTGEDFPASDEDGALYMLTPLYRLRPDGTGWVKDMAPGFLAGLRTAKYQWVEREEKGRYRMLQHDPPTILTSNHPDAV